MQKLVFPSRKLHQNIDFNSTMHEQDVYEVKQFLNDKGLYEKPDYGITPYPDKEMFDSIKKYQKSKNLKMDGVIKVDGETQDSMRVDREELPPLKLKELMIPGTNIPDRGIPEQGYDGAPMYNPFDYPYSATMDPNILRIPRPDIGKNMPVFQDDVIKRKYKDL